MTDLSAWTRLMEERLPFETDDRSGMLDFVEGRVSDDETEIIAVMRLCSTCRSRRGTSFTRR